MMIASIFLAEFIIQIDSSLQGESLKPVMPWLFTGGAEGARAVLSTIAGSMITIAGVVFSITIVALSLASSQFGPRLLRGFMRDRANQMVLGTFISTFLYCLWVLRMVSAVENDNFVPHLSIAIALILAVCSLGVLIYFIHHVSLSIQASTVIASVNQDLNNSIHEFFTHSPDKNPEDHHAEREVESWKKDASIQLTSNTHGYIQVVNLERLLLLAEDNDIFASLLVRPGHFVVEGQALASIFPSEKVTDKLFKKLQGCFVTEYQRSPLKDLEFALHQLVEVALRALSTGVNDPFTAINCIDYLGVGLSQLGKKSFPSSYCRGENGTIRIHSNPLTFEGALETACNQIRQAARGNAAVSIRMLEMLTALHSQLTEDALRTQVRAQAQLVLNGSKDLQEDKDRQDLEERFQKLCNQAEMTNRIRIIAASTNI
jgi:uncharacterized membrane protein